MTSRKNQRFIGNALIGVGLMMLVGLGGYFGWNQWQAARLQAQLLQASAPPETRAPLVAAPTVFSTSAPTAAPTPVERVAAASEQTTILPATSEAPLTSAAVVAAQPTLSSAPATSQPTRTPAPTSARAPAATPTEAPTAVPTPEYTDAGVPVRLVIGEPFNIDSKVVEMSWHVVQTASGARSEWVIPKNEAGHHINSAHLGMPGNIVISGHNNIYGKIFMPISRAWSNDRRTKIDDATEESDILNGRTIELYNAAGQVFSYKVTAFYRLKDTGVSLEQRIKNGRFLEPTTTPQLTLITCWPPTSNTHRLVVIAVPAD